ncbi:MAG: sigma-70 family RNA polymerase sigma factor [Bacteroidales bacterium]|nr:sigma-70 family RNA polymerase sigma factor [Bacteroidales bacterium]
MATGDKEILESIRNGENTRILQHLYDSILPKIKKYVCKNSGSEDDAFDVFQDGVMIFYKYVMSGKYNENYDISGFLYTVCKNLWINKARHNSRISRMDREIETTATAGNILDELMKKERETEVRQFLSKLGEKCRELLQLVFYYKLTTSEICSKMGFANEDTLKTKKYKCKQRLLQIMNNSRN